MSYWKFWLLGAAVVVVVVMSGNDPRREFAKLRQKNFESSIEESLSDKGPKLFGASRKPGGLGFSSVTPLEQQKMQEEKAPEWLRDPLASRPEGASQPATAPSNAAVFTPDAYLRSGERLQYVAGKVYRLKEDGTREILPDGRYVLSDGTTEIIVREGARVSE